MIAPPTVSALAGVPLAVIVTGPFIVTAPTSHVERIVAAESESSPSRSERYSSRA